MKEKLKQFLPHIAVIGIFIALCVAYFYPAFTGYKLAQSDITFYRGMSQEISAFRAEFDQEPLWTNSMFGGMPAYQISVKYPGDFLGVIDSIMTLGLPKPAAYVFLYFIGFYILLVTLRLKPTWAAVGAIGFGLASYYFAILIAGHNTKAHAIGYLAPLLAGIILTYRGKYLLGGAITALFMALEVDSNHVQITYYFGFLLLFYGIAKLVEFSKKGETPHFLRASGVIVGAVLIGVLANLNILWNTYEYGKYTTRGKSELTIKADGSSNIENQTEGLDRDYVTQWSYGIGESFSYIIPNVKGGKSGALIDQSMQRENPVLYNKIASGYQATQILPNSYWGNQPYVAGSVYFGVVVMLLFIFGLFFVKGPIKWALLATVLLTMMLSWGSNFMGLTNFFLDYIPGYNKFRAPTIILAITSFAVCVLAFLFLKQLLENRENFVAEQKKFLIVGGGSALLLLLFLAAPDVFFDFFSDIEKLNFNSLLATGSSVQVLDYMETIKEIRIEVFRSDTSRALIFVLITVGLIWLFLKNQLNPTSMAILLGVVIITDMAPIDWRYLNYKKEKGRYVQWQPEAMSISGYSASKADEFILDMESSQNPRVADAIKAAEEEYKSEQKGKKRRGGKDDQLNDARFAALRFNTNYRVLPLQGTFQDSRVAYFHKSVGGYHGAKLQRIQEFYDFQLTKDISALMQALQNNPTMESIQGALSTANGLNLLNTKYVIYNPEAPAIQNSNAIGSAWFVSDLLEADNADEEIQMINSLDIRGEAVVDKRFADQISGFNYQESADAGIAVVEHLPNYIKYTYESSVPQAAIFSEIYYEDGWRAYIDGEPADHFRANYVLRGMIIPEGTHEIEFKFEPVTYVRASSISTVMQVLLLALLVFAGYKSFKNKGVQE